MQTKSKVWLTRALQVMKDDATSSNTRVALQQPYLSSQTAKCYSIGKYILAICQHFLLLKTGTQYTCSCYETSLLEVFFQRMKLQQSAAAFIDIHHSKGDTITRFIALETSSTQLNNPMYLFYWQVVRLLDCVHPVQKAGKRKQTSSNSGLDRQCFVSNSHFAINQ